MSVAPTIRQTVDGAAILATWTLAQNQVGNPVSFTEAVDRTVQVTGTFGDATVVVEGSLADPPVNYATLTDPQGNSLSFSAPGIATVSEVVSHLRPHVIGGDDTTDLVCTLLMRRPAR